VNWASAVVGDRAGGRKFEKSSGCPHSETVIEI
jgi:hypothetical protein